MQFEFATAGQVIFRPGALESVGTIAALYGRRAFIACGVPDRAASHLGRLLEEAGLEWVSQQVSGEPTIESVRACCQTAQSAGADLVIGFGGGSAIDTAKAVAAMLTNPGELLDYLEVIGQGRAIQLPPAPFFAIPTTAGTGSEVTRNAVISVPERSTKVSLRSPTLVARVALVDPLLTHSVPPAVTASTGMDALAQVIEPFVSRRANLFTDLLCREGIVRAARSLRQAFFNGADAAAREDMAFTSLMGGMALANAGLGAVHGFAGPVGGKYGAPHGAVCATLLPAVVAANYRAMAEREPANPALDKYREIACLVTGRADASIDDLVSWLDDLRQALQIPGLGQSGMQIADLNALVEMSAVASSMKANPIVLTRDELREILVRST